MFCPAAEVDPEEGAGDAEPPEHAEPERTTTITVGDPEPEQVEP